ncbi:S-layer homology domain-containing protein [Cohnella sp. WQ 127256]|uniref:S-layer homology domain-containing protein n=1 Tax=Cohnella sp. WQ 127256 TaxID=2938790 RepID=UPI0021198F0D|nr:S-layer homology domain-containing protein [Cohnella sp. WQ 127256]
MKLPKFSLILTLMLIIGLVPFTASAASASVSLNAVSSIHIGESVTISGTSSFSEVNVKVVRPSNSVVFYDIVKVNAADSTFSISFTLGSGEAAGTYKIVAGQGNDVSTQDLVVEANGALGNADLSGLTLSTGNLNPTFAPGTTAYSASVANNVSSVTVRASVSDINATMTVNGITVASGQSSGAIGLIVGGNAISIVVTAKNGTSKTYSVSVTRASGGGFGGGGPSVITSTNGKLTLPAGGTGVVSLGDEITVSIPANATSKELQLTIEKLLTTQNLLTNREILASSIFEILKNFPENFSKPVTLTFVFDPAKLKGDQKPSVFYYDEVKKVWVEIGGKVTGNHITVDVDHFTKFAVLAVGQGDSSDSTADVKFSDISGHWAEANIKQAVSNGIVKGYTDGTFKPNKTVTRAEFAVMLMNALKPQEEGSALTFSDSAKIGAWAQKAVAQAVQAGIIKGYKDGTFRPDAAISRAEMASMIATALKVTVESNAEAGFADDKDIPTWAKDSVAALKKLAIVSGNGANKFVPAGQTTRAEAVTVLLRMLEQISK